MAKKVSKHSRAARRGEVDLEGEAKALSDLPKEENNEVRKSIIRTTIKNENLLARKMELGKIKKKGSKKLNSTLKNRAERNAKLEGILANKIQQSIDRANYVQGARRAGWDQINKSINVGNALAGQQEKSAAEQAEKAEREAEDEYVRQFFDDASKADSVSSRSDGTSTYKAPTNIFSVLEEDDN